MQRMSSELAPVMSELSTTPFLEALPHLVRIREALDHERDQQGFIRPCSDPLYKANQLALP